MHCVYIMQSLKDKGLYIGYTNDLNRRLKFHNLGKVFSTKSRLPIKLIYCEIFRSKEDALKRETSLKQQGQGIRRLKERLGSSFLV